MPRDGSKNLKPIQSVEQAKEMGRKGGIKSGEARRRKRTYKEILQLIGNSQIKDAKTKKLAENLGIDIEDITYAFMVNLAQVQKAIQEKDTRAAEYVRDTLGEKPATNTNVSVDMEDLTPLAELFKEEEKDE